MTKLSKSNRLIIGILLVGFILRLISINQSFWLDETTSAYVARDFDVLGIINFLKLDVHPPLYYLLLHGWGKTFGFSEIALRSLSVLVGVLSIYLIYLFAIEIQNLKYKTQSKIKSFKIKLFKIGNYFGFRNLKFGFPEVAALLLATSGLFVYYSQEVRMYVLEVFLALWASFSFIKLLEKDSIWVWFSYVLAICFLVASDYLPILIIVPFVLIAISRKKDFGWWKKYVLSLIPLFLLIIIWYPIFEKQLIGSFGVKEAFPVWWTTVGSTSLKGLILVPVKFVIGRMSFGNKISYLLFLILSMFPFVYTIYRSISKNKENLNLLLLIILPVFLAFIISFKISVFSYHRLIFILPFFYLAIALGLSSLNRRKFYLFFAWIIVVNLFSTGFYLLNPKFQREDWKGMLNYIRPSVISHQPSVVVLPSFTGTEAFRYYDPKGTIPLRVATLGSEKYDIIWLVRYAQPIFDPNDLLRTTIEAKGYKKESETDFNGVVVWKYIK